MFENALRDILAALKYFIGTVFSRPEDIKNNSMNEDPKPETLKETSAAVLCAVAKTYIGKDASPNNLAKSEVACAETVAYIVNHAFPGSLDPRIVGTDALFLALKTSKRFKGVLDPLPGTIEISPRTPSVNGHCGIYVGPDSIASNDSRTGKFQINYTRATWRKTFIQGRGLKAYLFVPVD